MQSAQIATSTLKVPSNVYVKQQLSTFCVDKFFWGPIIVNDSQPGKKPGRKEGYRKPNAMTGRIATRVPQELEDWLREEGEKLGLGIGDMARLLLLQVKSKVEKGDTIGFPLSTRL